MPAPPSDDRGALDRYGSWVPAAVLVGAVAVFWWPCLFGRMSPLLGDAQSQMRPWRSTDLPRQDVRWDILLWDGVAQYYPWRTFAARLAREDLIPLWNPHQFCGMPFVANGQSAFFYPPNWLFVLLDARYVFGLSAALHYLLAGVFMVLLARELGLSPTSALVAALAFAFGGFIVTWTELPTLMNSAVWLPAVVWAVERTFRQRTPTNALLIAGALAMSVLAGHLQIAAYVWLVAGVHALARCGLALYRRQRRVAALAITMFPLAAGLASVQLAPTFELAKLSLRGGATPDEEGFQFRKDRALQGWMLPTLVLPDAFGSPEEWSRTSAVAYSETCGYVGKLTLLLALLALAGIRSLRTLFFAGLAAAALLTAMAGPTARLLYYCVPGMAQAGGFGRALCVYTFAVATLAALGTERAIGWLRSRAGGSQLLPRLAPWVGALCVALILVDLAVWGRRFMPLSPRESVYPEPEIAARLREDAGTWRVLAVTKRDDWTIGSLPEAVLPPNSATAYGYDSIQGYDSLIPRAFGACASTISPEGYTPRTNGNMILIDSLAPMELGAASVKWVVIADDEPAPGDGFVEAARSGGVALYRNLYARPRALVGDGSVNTGLQLPTPVPILRTADAARVRCRLGGEAEGYLTVSDTMFPGWRAFVDGRPRQIAPALPFGRTVEVRRGETEAEMVYQPASFAAGMFVTLVAMGVVAAWLTWQAGRTMGLGDVGGGREL